MIFNSYPYLGGMIKSMEWENFFRIMDLLISDNGNLINKMVKELLGIKMELNMLVRLEIMLRYFFRIYNYYIIIYHLLFRIYHSFIIKMNFSCP